MLKAAQLRPSYNFETLSNSAVSSARTGGKNPAHC